MQYLRSRKSRPGEFENGNPTKMPATMGSNVKANVNQFFKLWVKAGKDWGRVQAGGPVSLRFTIAAFVPPLPPFTTTLKNGTKLEPSLRFGTRKVEEKRSHVSIDNTHRNFKWLRGDQIDEQFPEEPLRSDNQLYEFVLDPSQAQKPASVLWGPSPC